MYVSQVSASKGASEGAEEAAVGGEERTSPGGLSEEEETVRISKSLKFIKFKIYKQGNLHKIYEQGNLLHITIFFRSIQVNVW